MSNKIALLVALLLIPIVPLAPPAAAQTPTQADLVPNRLEPVGQPIVDMPTTLRLTVRNVGGTAFQAANNNQWEVFFYYLQNGQPTCISPTQTGQLQPPCVVADQSAQIGANGGEFLVQLAWTPTSAHKGLITIYANIRSRPCSADFTYQAPDATCAPDQGDPSQRTPPQPTNNIAGFSVFVGDPWVRAVPADRVLSDSATNANSPWKWEEVIAEGQVCPDGNKEHIRVACRAMPGTLVTGLFNIKNEGNIEDAYVASVVEEGPEPQRLSRLGYQFFFAPEAFTLDRNAERQVKVTVFIPVNASSHANPDTPESGINVNDSSRLRFRWTSTLNPTRSTDSDDMPADRCSPEMRQRQECGADPAFPTVVVDIRRDLYVESNQTHWPIPANVPYQFNVSINNTGNAPDRYRTRVLMDDPETTINHSWFVNFNELAAVRQAPTLLRGQLTSEGSNATITVVPPLNATRGQYSFAVDVQSVFATDGKIGRIVFLPYLQQRFGISGGSLTGLHRVVPGETAVYQMFLTNNGNGPDNVSISLENVPGGWPRTLEPPGPVIQIPAFSTVPIWLNVTPPANTLNETEAGFFLNVTSQKWHEDQNNPDLRVSVKTLLTVLRGPNLVVTHRDAREKFVDPQGTISFELDVRNVGNVNDNYTISYAPREPGWVVTTDPPYMPTTPLESKVLRVTLRAPSAAQVGEIQRFFVTVRSSVDPDARFQTVNVTARISGPDLFVSDVLVEGLEGADGNAPYSGDRLRLGVVLGNKGNKPPTIDGEPVNATLTLDYLVGDVPTLINQGRYVLGNDAIGAGRRTVFEVDWNTTGISGPLTIRARIDPDDAIDEIEEGPASNEARRAIVVRVFDISLAPAQPLSGRPGQRVSYGEDPNLFYVEYRGNQPNEPVKVRFVSENGWVSKEMDLALPQNARIPLPIDLTIPAEPGVATDRLTLSITPVLRPRSTITAAVVTTVIDDEKPVIVSATVTPDPVKLREPAEIRAIIRDATGLSQVVAVVAEPGAENRSQRIPLTPAGGNVFTATASFAFAGEYRYFIEAVDRSTSANKNSSEDRIRTFNVSVATAPVIVLAPGQELLTRSANPIRLRITDVETIGKVTYSVRGVSSELAKDRHPEYVIDASQFQQGRVDVSVTASNVYGATTTANFTFTIDNTPPAIRKVTGPTEAKINEPVTVKIETDLDATKVQVAVRRGDQIVDTLNATKKGSAWEVVVSPQQGANVLDVTVADKAGNENIQRAALTIEGETKGLFDLPGFEAVAALAVLGAAAVAMRRRRT